MPLNDDNIIKIRRTYELFQEAKNNPYTTPGKILIASIRRVYNGRFYTVLSRIEGLLKLDGNTLDINFDDLTEESFVTQLNELYKSTHNAVFNHVFNLNVSDDQKAKLATKYLREIKKLRNSLGHFAYLNNLNFARITQDAEGVTEQLKAIKHKKFTQKVIADINQAAQADNLKIQNRWLDELAKLGYPITGEDLPVDNGGNDRTKLLKYLKKYQKKIANTPLSTEEDAKIESRNKQYKRRIEWSWVDEETKRKFQIEKLKKAKKYLENFYKAYRLPENFSKLDAKIKELEENKLLSKVAETYKQYRWAHNRYWFVHYPKDFVTWLRRRSGDPTLFNLFSSLGKLVNLDSDPFNPNLDSPEDLVKELNRVYQLALRPPATNGKQEIQEIIGRQIDKKVKVARKKQAKKASAQAKKSLCEIKKLRRYYCDFALAHNLNLNNLIKGSGNGIDELKKIKHQEKIHNAAKAIKKALKKSKQEYKDSVTRKLRGRVSNEWLRELVDQGFALPDTIEVNDIDSKEALEAYLQVLQNNIIGRGFDVEDRKQIARRNFWLRPVIKLGLVSELSESHYQIKRLRKAKQHLQRFYDASKLSEDFGIIDNKIENLRDGTYDYLCEYRTTKKLFEDLINSPWKTALRHKFIPDVFNKKHNKPLFFIIKQLHLMRLSKHADNLIKAFLETDKQEIQNSTQAKQRLKEFLDLLYATFNALSIQEHTNQDDLKKLKKLIHAFAEQNDFEKKLFNLHKAYRKKVEDEEVTNKLTMAPHRVYGYLQNSVNRVNGKKIKNRRRKKIIRRITFAVTLIVALGEGIMAAVFLGPLVALPIILLVGICGFDVNYFLFRKDSYEAFKQLFITGIFKDSRGYEISTTKKVLINASIISSIAIALVFGSFTFNTALVAGTAALGLLSIAFPPAAIAFAAILAIVAVVANATMFYCMMADFVKNDRILQIAAYFKRNYWDVWKQPIEWASASPYAITTGMKVKHYLSAVATVGLNILFLAAGLTVCAFMTMITLGLGHTQAVEVMGKIANFAPHVKDFVAEVVVSALAAPLNSFFYWRGILRVLNTVKEKLISLGRAICSPFKSLFALFREAKELKDDPIRMVETVSDTTLMTAHIGAAVCNGGGQGAGPYHDENSNENVKSVFDAIENALKEIGIHVDPHLQRFGEAHAKELAGIIAGLGSFGVNTLQIIRALLQPENAFFISLAPPVQLMLLTGKLTFDQARALSHESNRTIQIELAEKAIDGALSTYQILRAIKPDARSNHDNVHEEKQSLIEHSQDLKIDTQDKEDIAPIFDDNREVGSTSQVKKHVITWIEPQAKKESAYTFFARGTVASTNVEQMRHAADDIFKL